MLNFIGDRMSCKNFLFTCFKCLSIIFLSTLSFGQLLGAKIGQSSGLQYDVEIAEKITAVKQFFRQIEGKHIRFHWQEQGKEIKADVRLGDKTRSLFIKSAPFSAPSANGIDEKFFMQNEWLFHNDGTMLSAWNRPKVASKKSEAANTLRGRLDFRSAQIGLQVGCSIIMGLEWTGKETVDFLSEEYWGNRKFVEFGNGIRHTNKLGTRTEFEFEFKHAKPIFKKLKIDFPQISDAQRQLPNWYIQSVTYEFEFKQDQFSGWSTSINAFRKSDGEQTTISKRSIDSVTDLTPKHPVSFLVIDVKKGAEIHVFDDPGTTYVFNDGKLLKVVDHESIKIIEALYESTMGRQPPPRNFEEWKTDVALVSYLRSRGDATHCGVYSLAAGGALLGRWLDVEKLLANPELTTSHGSSVKGLVGAAEEQGLVATTISNSGASLLRSVDSPVLLHLGHSYQAQGVSHWFFLSVWKAVNSRFSICLGVLSWLTKPPC